MTEGIYDWYDQETYDDSGEERAGHGDGLQAMEDDADEVTPCLWCGEYACVGVRALCPDCLSLEAEA